MDTSPHAEHEPNLMCPSVALMFECHVSVTNSRTFPMEDKDMTWLVSLTHRHNTISDRLH